MAADPVTAASPPAIITPHPGFGVAAVLIGATIAGLNLRLTSFGLADIRGGMGLSFDDGSWFSTCFNAAQLLLAPPVAYLSRAIGARRILLPSVVVYGALTILLPFAPEAVSAWTLQLLRGAAAGTFLPAAIAFMVQGLPPRARIWGIAAYAFCSIFTSNVAASVEGFFGDSGAWRWVFWQTAVLCVPMLLLVRRGMVLQPLRWELLRTADWGGLLLCGAGLMLLYMGLDQGNRLDWLNSGTVCGLLLAGALLLLGFAANELLRADPWVRLRVIGAPRALLPGLTMMLFTTSTLTGIIVLPNYLNNVQGLRSIQVGDALVWAVVPPVLLLPLAVALLRRGTDPRLLLGLGIALQAISAWLCTGLTSEWSGANFLPAVALQGCGQTLAILNLVVVVLSGIRGMDEIPTVSAWLQIARLMGAESGAALLNTLLRTREQLASNLIGQHVTAGAWTTQDALAGFAVHAGTHDPATSHAQAVIRLAGLVKQQATVIACLDVFWLLAWLSLAALALVAFIPRVPRSLV